MSVAHFLERMKPHITQELECVVTKNRSTMLRLLEKTKYRARLSLHEMFLTAPDEVLVAIAAYIGQSRKDKKLHQRAIREYVHQHYGEYSYKRPRVESLGKHYDLERLKKEINATYFSGELEVTIGWFKGGRPRRKILFGKYEESLRLVRLNDCLDDPSIPEFFVRYVVYHEMLHAVIPSYMQGGRLRMHGAEFKKREKLFLEYERARKWEKENKEKFFGRA